MPQLQVSIVLPYYLRLDEGDYRTGQGGEEVRVVAPQLVEGSPPQTQVRAFFNPGCRKHRSFRNRGPVILTVCIPPLRPPRRQP